MNKASPRRIHVRGLISLLTAMSFLIMSISGIVLFIVPQGRIANWIDWRFLALTKGQWGDMPAPALPMGARREVPAWPKKP